MLFVLLVSVGDALLVATELTLDILAIKIRKLSARTILLWIYSIEREFCLANALPSEYNSLMITIGNHFRVWGVKLSEVHAFANTKLL